MGTEAHAIRPNACAIRVRRGALWLHTCRRAETYSSRWSATPPEVELRICLAACVPSTSNASGIHGRFVGKENRSIEM